MAKKTDQSEPTDSEAATPEAVQPKVLAPVRIAGPGRIRVVRTYNGYRTGENAVEPGVYAADDPLLFGIAEYLLAEGYAEFYV